ncbi:MAG TPA: hypothetical protein DCM02_09955 [Flavobacterium sp.]|nr:hypothetical protein [Flavobacterium sp.]
MSKITYTDHLDDMIERLMNEDISKEQLEIEVTRCKSVCQIVNIKIADKKITLQAMKMLSNGDIDKKFIPKEFSELKQIENGGS